MAPEGFQREHTALEQELRLLRLSTSAGFFRKTDFQSDDKILEESPYVTTIRKREWHEDLTYFMELLTQKIESPSFWESPYLLVYYPRIDMEILQCFRVLFRHLPEEVVNRPRYGASDLDKLNLAREKLKSRQDFQHLGSLDTLIKLMGLYNIADKAKRRASLRSTYRNSWLIW